MLAPVRKLAFLGAVFCSIFSYPISVAHAQDQATTPTGDMAPVLQPAPTTPPANVQPPVMTAPSDDSVPVPSAPSHRASHKKSHKKSTHHTTGSRHHKSSGKAAAKGDAHLRDAQTHLANLLYYKGKIDGINGPQTRAAIKAFQHDNKLPSNGKLNQPTYDALIAADKQKAMSSLPPVAPIGEPMPQVVGAEPMPPEAPPMQGPDFYATHPDFYGHYHQSYENAVQLGPNQTLYSRYAKIDLAEDQTPAPTKKYNITLNGLPLILVDNQPSVIGVSRTFELGDEDVIIFTTFRDNDSVCAYAYNLLILSADGTKSRAIQNCTRGYQAKAANNVLFITFPEGDDGRAVGATWKYDHGDLEKL